MRRLTRPLWACLALGVLCAAAPAPAGDFTPDELDDLVAPVALYPDDLLGQVLMAATYPLEIVQARRWSDDHPDLSGDALDDALRDEDWDASVEALCAFPDVLAQLDDDLGWAQDLGDAVLAQQDDVLDAVQRMRRRAADAGELGSDEHVLVDDADGELTVESDDDDVVYVPVYAPRAVYGAWRPRARYSATLYGEPGVRTTYAAVRGARTWARCDWRAGELAIDAGRYDAFARHTQRAGDRRRLDGVSGGRARWTHDPAHRGGVNYRDGATARRYGGTAGSARVDHDVARGRSITDGLASRGTSTARASTTSGRRTSTHGASSALSGSRDAHLDRSASDRGSRSRSTSSRGRGGRRR